jgi:hypothetical protein
MRINKFIKYENKYITTIFMNYFDFYNISLKVQKIWKGILFSENCSSW